MLIIGAPLDLIPIPSAYFAYFFSRYLSIGHGGAQEKYTIIINLTRKARGESFGFLFKIGELYSRLLICAMVSNFFEGSICSGVSILHSQ